MLAAAILAIAWPGAGGVEPFSRAFWIHQVVSAVGSLVFVRWVASLAARHARDQAAKVIPFRRRP